MFLMFHCSPAKLVRGCQVYVGFQYRANVRCIHGCKSLYAHSAILSSVSSATSLYNPPISLLVLLQCTYESQESLEIIMQGNVFANQEEFQPLVDQICDCWLAMVHVKFSPLGSGNIPILQVSNGYGNVNLLLHCAFSEYLVSVTQSSAH